MEDTLNRQTQFGGAKLIIGIFFVLHGLLPHYSAANRSPHSRQAYTLHVIDAAATYRADNWLQRGPDLPLRGFDPVD